MKRAKLRIQSKIITTCLFANLFAFNVQANEIEINSETTPTTIEYTTAISNNSFSSYYTYLKYKINYQYGITSDFTADELKEKLLDANFKRDLAHLSFISRYGIDNLNSFANSEERKNFLTWLFQNVDVLNKFLEGGAPVENKFVNSLSIFEKIWESDLESHEGIYLTLSMATSLQHAKPIDTGWYQVDLKGKGTIIDPISRYNNYKNAQKNGKLYPVFDTLDVSHMRLVVGAWITDSDLDWARETYSGPHSIISETGTIRNFNKEYNRSNITDAGHELQYNTYNASGTSVQNGTVAYYGANATLETVLKVGGVCGAIAKYGASVAQAYGVPATPIGQPGHAAAIYNKEDGVWSLHNNISGFGESFTHGGTVIPWNTTTSAQYVNSDGQRTTASFGPAYMLLFEDAFKDSSSLFESERLRLLAKEITTADIAKNIRYKAIEICPKNIEIWRDQISALKQDSNTSASEWSALNNNIILKFAEHPRAMTELLTSIENNILTGASEENKSIYVNSIFNAYELVTSPQQVQIRDIVEKSMASWMFNYIPKPTITFSFSGSNADKLMGFKNGMSFSIDGGKTFLYPSDNDYKFSIPELNSLTSQNKILVRNKYSTATTQDKMTLIEIKENGSRDINVYADDIANTLNGIDTTMEFSLNKGLTWTAYNGTNLPDLSGNLTLLVRKSGNDLMMSSEIVELTYTSEINLAINKKSIASSTYGNGPTNKVNDGNSGSSWLCGGGNPQWIYVDLGKTFYVNRVKLNWADNPANWESHGKKYKIQVSNKLVVTEDPNDWIDVYSTESGNGGIDNISFASTPARYIRMYATELEHGWNLASLHEFEVYDGNVTETEWKKPGVNYLSDMAWISCSNGWGIVGLDMSTKGAYDKTGQRISLDGKQYLKGLGAHADSQIQYNLDGKYTNFSADIGIDDAAGESKSSVIYEVIADTTTIYKSDTIINSSPIQHLNLDVTGAKLLTLKVSDAGDGNSCDHADWAGAYLTSTEIKPFPNVIDITPLGKDISIDAKNINLRFDKTVTAVNNKYVTIANDGTLYKALTTDGLVSGNDSNCIASIPINNFADSNGNKLTLESSKTYSVSVEAGAYKDSSNNDLEVTSGRWVFTTAYAPIVTDVSLSGKNVSKNTSNLEIFFDKTVRTIDGKYVIINVNGKDYKLQPKDNQIIGIDGKCRINIPLNEFKDESNNPLILNYGQIGNIAIEGGVFVDQTGVPIKTTTEMKFTVEKQSDVVSNVTADDVNNTINGIDDTMEFSIDNGTTWMLFDGKNLPNLTGNIAIKIRKAETENLMSGTIAELIFTDGKSDNLMVTKQPNVTYISDIPWVTSSNGYGTVELDTSNGGNSKSDGRNININGVTYTKGLGCHADSTITYNLEKNYSRFVTDVGADNEASGTVQFEIIADGNSIYKSDILNNKSKAEHVDLNVTGITTLTLKVTNGGNGNGSDHADWAGAYLVPADKTVPTFDQEAGTTLDETNKIVTLTFSEEVMNALGNLDELKSAIAFSKDGINYSPLSENDTVTITNGKVVVTFNSELTGNKNKIKIAANTIKDKFENLKKDTTETNAIIGAAEILKPSEEEVTTSSSVTVVTPSLVKIKKNETNNILTAIVEDNDGNKCTEFPNAIYEWYRDEKLLDEKITENYQVVADDKGKNIKVVVRIGGKKLTDTIIIPKDEITKTEIPAQTGISELIMPSVRIIGTERVGNTLSAEFMNVDTLVTTSSSISYKWCKSDNKETENWELLGKDKAYQLTNNDQGKYIKLIAIYNGKRLEDITSRIARKLSSGGSSSSSKRNETYNNDSTDITVSNTNKIDDNSINVNIINNNLNSTDLIWKKNSNDTWNLLEDGQLITGWKQVKDLWYFMDSDGAMKKDWQKIKDKWYLLKNDGSMVTGWQQNDNKWYYLHSTGEMATGWQNINNKWYLLQNDGSMATGWKKVDGKWYYLYNDGSMAINTKIDGYNINSNGEWS